MSVRRATGSVSCVAAMLIAWAGGVCAHAGDAPMPRVTNNSPFDPRKLLEQFVEAFDAGEYDAAVLLGERMTQALPRHPVPWYNLACARARVEDLEGAEAALREAIAWGFTDFHTLLRDKSLEPLRESVTVRGVRAGWAELLDARRAADEEVLRRGLGDGYVFERDDELRLTWASSFDAESTAMARDEVVRVAQWVEEHLPGLMQASAAGSAAGSRGTDPPDAWASVVLPNPIDFAALVGDAGIGGYYDKDRKRLVSSDIGPSMRHEFFHILHWRHMERLGQEHPIWIQEGLACLFEAVAPDAEAGGEGQAGGGETPRIGSTWFEPCWRTNIARNLARAGGLTRWDQLFTMPRERYMGSHSRARYAESRAVFLYLADLGVIDEWYAAYTAGYDQDPSGARAMERVLGKPLREAEREFRMWTRSLPEVGEVGDWDLPSLGAMLTAGAGDGPVVRDVVLKRRDGDLLRRRDAVLAVNGTPTPTLDELNRVLGGLKAGDKVTVLVRRNGQRVELAVILVDGREMERVTVRF